MISSEGRRETFSYDGAGNRLTRKSGKKQEFYRYDSRNRLVERIERNDSTPTFSTQYHYDAQRNLLEEVKKKQKIIPFQKKRYDYNGFQQMKRVEKEDIPNQKKEWQENKYDAENLRYQMEENGESTQFLTDGWQILTEVGEKDQEKKRLIRGYGIVASEEREYHTYHTNEHGDVELILGGKGEIENQYQYDAFGRITKAEEFVGNRYTYVGEVYDSLTMQYYLRARYYNPQIARFIQEDEYRGDGLNLYAYCANNPVRYIDPSGYGEESEACATGNQETTRSNYKFSANADTHLNNVDGFDKNHTGIKGAHNVLSFIGFERPTKVIGNIRYSNFPGIFEIDYDVAKMNRGKPDGWLGKKYTKTLFDPCYISVADLRKWAEEAFDGVTAVPAKQNQLYIKGTAKNGVKFEGWIDIGTQEIKSYYPVLKWNNE